MDPSSMVACIAMARYVCRDPAPGPAAGALARIDAAMSAAEALIARGGPESYAAIGLVHGAATIAATERLDPALS